MTRKIVQKVPQIWRDCQVYINQRVLSSQSGHAFENTKKPVRKWLNEHGETTEDGNITYTFPRPITGVDGKTYSGVELRPSRGQPAFIEDDVKEFFKLREQPVKGWLDRVFPLRRVFDPDELYVLHQEDEISEDELRGLLHYPDPSYALWPIEAVEILEEDD